MGGGMVGGGEVCGGDVGGGIVGGGEVCGGDVGGGIVGGGGRVGWVNGGRVGGGGVDCEPDGGRVGNGGRVKFGKPGTDGVSAVADVITSPAYPAPIAANTAARRVHARIPTSPSASNAEASTVAPSYA